MIPERYRDRIQRSGLDVKTLRDKFGIEPKTDAEWDILMNAEMKLHPDPLPKPYASEDIDLFSEGYMTVKQVAHHLQLHRATIYRAMERGELPFNIIKRTRRIPRKALRIWTEAY